MKEELKSIDIETRKLMTMSWSLHLKGNIRRLYLANREGGRGLISCEECVNVEVQSLGKYLSESKEWILKIVAREKGIRIIAGEKGLSEVEDLDAFKKHLNKEKTSQWLEKLHHGRFLKDTEKASTERTLQWLKGGILRKTGAMFCAAQEQPVKLNSIKHHTEDQGISPMCRLCGELSETVMHLSSGCPVLAKSKYRLQHEIVGKHIHWLPLKKYWKQLVQTCTRCCDRETTAK